MELNRDRDSSFPRDKNKQTKYSFAAEFKNKDGEFSITENLQLSNLFKKVVSDTNLEYVRGFLDTSPDKYKLYQHYGYSSRFIDLLLTTCEGYGMAAMLVREYGACPGIRDTNEEFSAIEYAHQRDDHTFAKFLELLADEQEEKLQYFQKSRSYPYLDGPEIEFHKEFDY